MHCTGPLLLKQLCRKSALARLTDNDPPTDTMASSPPSNFTPADAALVCTLVAAQIDRRFLALDLSSGSKIDWAEIASGVSERTGRQFTPPMCQRLWRYCVYGEDVGSLPHLLPDSDGEDEDYAPRGKSRSGAEPVNPRVSDGERAAMEQTLSRVADEAAAALQAYPPSVAGPAPNSHPAVAAAGLPRAAHAIVDRAVRATLGPQPSRKRSAYELFVLQYQKEAKRMVADDAAAAEAGVSGAMSTAAALTQNVYKLSAELHAFGGSLTAEARAEAEAQVVSARTAAAAAEDHVEAARSALAAARAVTPRNKLSALWDALMGPRHAAQRGEWEMRALMDERRWLDEERAYAERYGQLYRLYALQSSLCAQHVGAALADIDVSIRAGFALGPAVAAAATHAGALARPPTSMHASASAAANGARTVASAATASGAAAGAPGFGGTTMFQLARS